MLSIMINLLASFRRGEGGRGEEIEIGEESTDRGGMIQKQCVCVFKYRDVQRPRSLSSTVLLHNKHRFLINSKL